MSGSSMTPTKAPGHSSYGGRFSSWKDVRRFIPTVEECPDQIVTAIWYANNNVGGPCVVVYVHDGLVHWIMRYLDVRTNTYRLQPTIHNGDWFAFLERAAEIEKTCQHFMRLPDEMFGAAQSEVAYHYGIYLGAISCAKDWMKESVDVSA